MAAAAASGAAGASITTSAMLTQVLMAAATQPDFSANLKIVQALIADGKFWPVFEQADKRLSEFKTLESYANDRKTRVGLFKTVVIEQIWPKMEALMHADIKACVEVPLSHLPQPVITGSVAHGLSYADGDLDFAWVLKTMPQLRYAQSLFARCFADDAKPFTGKAGTVVEKAVFFVGKTGFDFKTLAGLPWVPFMLGGLKFDQTFRLESQHALIEKKAAEGNALLLTDDAKMAHMQKQHWLQLVKTAFAGLKSKAKEDDKDKTGLTGAAAFFEAVYMLNKKPILPDRQQLTQLAVEVA